MTKKCDYVILRLLLHYVYRMSEYHLLCNNNWFISTLAYSEKWCWTVDHRLCSCICFVMNFAKMFYQICQKKKRDALEFVIYKMSKGSDKHKSKKSYDFVWNYHYVNRTLHIFLCINRLLVGLLLFAVEYAFAFITYQFIRYETYWRLLTSYLCSKVC